MSDEVGKVSLGIEFDGNDISKQLEKMSGKMGDSLSKAFESAVKGMDFKPVTESITTALKEITAFDSVVDSIKGKLSSMKIPSVSAIAPTPAAAASPVAKTRQPKSVQPFDTGKAEAEIERLSQVIDNVNGKIEVQRHKLSQLKDSYDNTFKKDSKMKIQEDMLKVESTILRLTKQADDAAGKMWKLDDAIDKSKNSSKAATAAIDATAAATQKSAVASEKASDAVQKSGKSNQQAGKSAKILTGGLNNATRAALGTDKAFKSAGKSSGVMGNQFTQAFGRIAKQVLVFSVLYKAIRGFQGYMNSSMKTNQQYVASLNAIKTNLATAFQPIFSAVMPAINAFMSWLAKATAYIAAFMSSLFGTSYKKSFAAAKGIQTAKKEIAGYGKAAKKAGKEANGALAGFDEINALDFSKDSADSGGGGGGAGDWNMEMPDMDIDKIQSQTDKLVASMKTSFSSVWESIKNGWNSVVTEFSPTFKEAWSKIEPEFEGWKTSFSKVFSDIITLGEPLKNWVQNNLLPVWKNGILLAADIVSGLSESVRMVFDDIWAAAFPIIDKFVTEGLPRLTEFVTGLQEIFRSMFDVVKTIFDDIWQDAVQPAIDLVSQIIRDALDIIFDWWDEWGTKIVGGIKESLDSIKEIWNELWEKFLKPITQRALKFLKDIWDKHLKGLLEEIGKFIGKLATGAMDIFNKFIAPIVKWLVKTLGPIFSEVFDGVATVITTVLGAIIDAAKGIIKALGGIIDFIVGVFTGDWEKAWEGIKTFFSGIGDALESIFKGAVNAIIDALNWMLKQVNKINIDIPDWVPGVGGKNIGFKIPEIPRLAKGGLAYAPTLAMVGDNRGAAADPEVIAPLSKLQDILSNSGQGGMNEEIFGVLQAILQVLQRSADRPVVLEANGTQLAKVTTESNNDVTRRAGRTMAVI